MLRLALGLAAVSFAAGQEPAPDLDAGRRVFESQCAVCHGLKGGGGRGPSLNRPKLNKAPDDTALRTLISTGSEPEMPGAWQLSPHEVVSVAAFVRSLAAVAPETLPGDPARGARVYTEQGCAGCHIVAGQGRGFGPELTTVGTRRSGAHLRESLVNPGGFVPEEFASAEAVTASGETVRGIRANEDSFTIQIKDSAGRFRSFRKAELKSYQVSRNDSSMPSYERTLKPDDVNDLVAFLAGLRGKE